MLFPHRSPDTNKYCRWHDERLWINHPSPAEEEPVMQWPPSLLHIESWHSLRAAYVMTKVTIHPQQITLSQLLPPWRTWSGWWALESSTLQNAGTWTNSRSARDPKSHDWRCRWDRWAGRWTFDWILTDGRLHLWGSARHLHVARFILVRKRGWACGSRVMTELGSELSTANRSGEL